jgi:hypothetical protein
MAKREMKENGRSRRSSSPKLMRCMLWRVTSLVNQHTGDQTRRSTGIALECCGFDIAGSGEDLSADGNPADVTVVKRLVGHHPLPTVSPAKLTPTEEDRPDGYVLTRTPLGVPRVSTRVRPRGGTPFPNSAFLRRAPAQIPRCDTRRRVTVCSNWLLPQICNAGPSDALSCA